MARTIFQPSTVIKSAEINANFDGAYDGSLDVPNNSLATFRNENVNNYIQSGVIAAATTGLGYSISAGVAYIGGNRVVVAGGTYTAAASQFTYIDLKPDGTFVFQTTAAPVPALAVGNIRIAFVNAGASTITSIKTDGGDNSGNTIRPTTFLRLTEMKPQAVANTVGYQNGWVDYDPTTWGGIYYWRDSTGMVHMQGLCKSGVVTVGTIMFTLPPGFRPALGFSTLFTCGSNDSYCRIDVGTNGNVVTGANVNANWVSLANIHFRAVL